MSALTDVFTNIANAIRSKKGVSTTYKPSEMASAISSIPTGRTVTERVLWTNPNSPSVEYTGGTIDFPSQVNIRDESILIRYADNRYANYNVSINKLAYNQRECAIGNYAYCRAFKFNSSPSDGYMLTSVTINVGKDYGGTIHNEQIIPMKISSVTGINDL
jgi:hypothetical protein